MGSVVTSIGSGLGVVPLGMPMAGSAPIGHDALHYREAVIDYLRSQAAGLKNITVEGPEWRPPTQKMYQDPDGLGPIGFYQLPVRPRLDALLTGLHVLCGERRTVFVENGTGGMADTVWAAHQAGFSKVYALGGDIVAEVHIARAARPMQPIGIIPLTQDEVLLEALSGFNSRALESHLHERIKSHRSHDALAPNELQTAVRFLEPWDHAARAPEHGADVVVWTHPDLWEGIEGIPHGVHVRDYIRRQVAPFGHLFVATEYGAWLTDLCPRVDERDWVEVARCHFFGNDFLFPTRQQGSGQHVAWWMRWPVA